MRPWTATVHHLLRHLEDQGFAGAPRALGVDAEGREELSFLAGDTVGDRRPWPAWVHSGAALDQVGRWLRGYHDALAGYVPPADARWRQGGAWRPGLVVGHGDAAPYNAVWRGDTLVGFVDWDDAEPVSAEDDLAWLAFSWTPLHARSVVTAEGFTDLEARPERLARVLEAYGWTGTTAALLARVDAVLVRRLVAARARGRHHDLEQARRELASWAW